MQVPEAQKQFDLLFHAGGLFLQICHACKTLEQRSTSREKRWIINCANTYLVTTIHFLREGDGFRFGGEKLLSLNAYPFSHKNDFNLVKTYHNGLLVKDL